MVSSFDKKEPAPRILPRIKNLNFVESLKTIPGMNENSMPMMEHLVGDLILTYAFDLGDNFAIVNQFDLKKYHLKQEDLRLLAVANVHTTLEKFVILSTGDLHQIITNALNLCPANKRHPPVGVHQLQLVVEIHDQMQIR